MRVRLIGRRVQRYIAHQLRSPVYRWEKVADPRDRRGRRWKRVGELLDALLVGSISACKALRHVEGLTEDMGALGRSRISRRVPDTTLSHLIPRLGSEDLRQQLITQVKGLWRAKSLNPVGLPCGVITIDGKGTGTLGHSAHETAQKNYREDGSEYFLSRMFRAVLSSAESRPCIDQMHIGAKSNEVGDFAPFYNRLVEAYGSNNTLFEIVDVDAGMASKHNANVIDASMKGYVIALKDNQPELLAEAKRLMGKLRKPEIQTQWERAQGKRMQRRLYRSSEMAGYHDWHHLRQVWRIEQVAEYNQGRVECENRYFITSIPWGRLSAEQILLVVRSHWRVENDCFWTLDMQWLEDSAPWCKTGRSVEILSWIRLMAYNLLQQLRRRHLRKKIEGNLREPPPPWQRVFAWVNQAWQLPMEGTLACG